MKGSRNTLAESLVSGCDESLSGGSVLARSRIRTEMGEVRGQLHTAGGWGLRGSGGERQERGGERQERGGNGQRGIVPERAPLLVLITQRAARTANK